MELEYNILAFGNSFYIESNNEDIHLKFEQQEAKGEDTVEIEGWNFKVKYAGASLRLEGIYDRIHILSSQPNVTLKSIYAAILDVDEEKLDSDRLYKNFGTIHTIAAKRFELGEAVDWEAGKLIPIRHEYKSTMATEIENQLEEGWKKERELTNQIGHLEHHNLYYPQQSTNLLDRMTHLHSKCKFQETRLKTQLKNHQIELLKNLKKYDQLLPLNSIEHLQQKEIRLQTMLSLAIKAEQMALIKDVLKMGVKPQAAHFFDAILTNSPDMMELVFKHNDKMDINERKTENGWTFLHLACAAWSKPSGAIQWLVAHGADVDAQAPMTGYTPLHLGMMRESIEPEMIRLLLEHSHNANAQNGKGNTLLHLAILNQKREGDEKLLSLLLDYLDPNVKNNQGNTPLHEACQLNQATIKQSISTLLEAGAVATVQNHEGSTPLHYLTLRSCDKGTSKENQEIAQLLIQKGASVKQRDRRGATPLHMAVYRSFNNNRDFISYLIKQGADLNAQDEEGNTPLHYAAMSGHVEGVRTLLKHGANKNIRNKEGYLPIGSTQDVNVPERSKQIVNLLL